MPRVLRAVRTPLTQDDWRALGLDRLRVGHTLLEPGDPEMVFGDPPDGDAPAHPNTATKIDHAVLRVPNIDRAIEDLGLEERRRGGPRAVPMSFLRAGEAIVELVETGEGPIFSGVVLRVASMEEAVRVAGPRLQEPHPAIQGGWIAEAARQWDGFAVALLEKGESRKTE
jgi:hypothetical protein